MLITLSGVDGAGKSTQIARLQDYLHLQQQTTKIFWLRPGYSCELDALRAAVRHFSASPLPTAEQPESREKVFSTPGVSQMWVVMALVDLLYQYAAKLPLWLQRYDVVICDRYLFDAELDFLLRFPELQPAVSASFVALRRLCPTPDVSLLLMLPYQEMERRLAQKNEPFPEEKDQRRIRWQHYSRAAELDSFITIEASASIKGVHERVLAHVIPHLDGED